MRNFKDLGIKVESQGFTGDKIKISRILNKEIIVHDFKIVDSKFGKGNEKCMYLQISISSTKHVVFTGSIALAETIQRVERKDFPFTTIIVKENERYEFT